MKGEEDSLDSMKERAKKLKISIQPKSPRRTQIVHET